MGQGYLRAFKHKVRHQATLALWSLRSTKFLLPSLSLYIGNKLIFMFLTVALFQKHENEHVSTVRPQEGATKILCSLMAIMPVLPDV